MKVVSAEQMREIDRVTIHEYGVPSLVLMERAGESVANRIESIFEKRPVVVLSGGGNNGGDGIVIGRILSSREWDVRVILLFQEDRLSPDCLSQCRIAKKMGLKIEFKSRVTSGDVRNAVIVDSLLGTGLNKPVKGHLLHAITSINKSRSPVVSVDIPSGISSDTGQIMGQSVRADYTVTFGLAKIGHMIHPGAEYSGKLFVEDIGFPESLTASEELHYNLIDLELVQKFVKKRKADTHKGTYGHVFVIAGSQGKTGAALLAAEACMRSGAGAVTLGVPEKLIDIFQSRVFEEMTIPLSSNNEGTFSDTAVGKALDFISERADVVLIGPGISVNDDVIQFVRDVILNARKPLLIDADGLNCLAQYPDILKKSKSTIVITPHPNEMRRLMSKTNPQITAAEINRNRIEIAEHYAQNNGVITVLKGVPTIVATPEDDVYINTSGNPGMATAGSGDVLSGIVSSFMGQGLGGAMSAVCGVYMHGLSGDIGSEEIGEYSLVAGDIIRYLPEAFQKVMAGSSP